MRQSNALNRFCTFLKKEEVSLTKYYQKEVRNERTAKMWDDKNLELASIYEEFCEEMKMEARKDLKYPVTLSVIDNEIENLKANSPEISKLMIEVIINDKKGYTSYLSQKADGFI
jgi:hypothetical protein